MKKENYDVSGMTCSSCVAHVQKAVEKLPGVKEANVNLLTKTMAVSYDEDKESPREIISAVEKAGYGATLKSDEREGDTHTGADNSIAKKNEDEVRALRNRLIVSAVFAGLLMVVAMIGHEMFPAAGWVKDTFAGADNALVNSLTQLLLLLPVIYINKAFFVSGFKSLFGGAPNMDTLVALGSGAGSVYGVYSMFRLAAAFQANEAALYAHDILARIDFESSGMILALITLGKFFEALSKGKTSKALENLMGLAPKTANVIIGENEVSTPVERLKPGDIVIVRPGEAFPADGEIISGETEVDEAALTGESIPVYKKEAEKVSAATLNISGAVKVRVGSSYSDFAINKIIKMVEDAGASKAPVARIADKVAGVFVPIVMGLAAVTFFVWLISGSGFDFALTRAITVLVISCPCAMGLATPVAIMVGTGKGAEYGILIKSGESLEEAGKVTALLLDKTGTITKGMPEVTDVYISNGLSGDEFFKLLASLENKSEHPLAKAIVRKAADLQVSLEEIYDFKAYYGKGVSGDLNGKRLLAGNAAFLKSEGVDMPYTDKLAAFANEGKTPLIFALDKKIAGIVALRDEPREGVKEDIEIFHRMGIKVVMVTGDNKKTAEALAKEVGIGEVYAEVLPEEKKDVVEEYKNKGFVTGFVGDGVNDAPALVSADYGVAIGAGTDVAIESADAVIIKNNLRDVASSILLSKATIRNIKQNLFWAFFYNVICIPIAAGVFYPAFGIVLKPMFGSLAMGFSSVFVVVNALRLRTFNPEKFLNKAEEWAKAGEDLVKSTEEGKLKNDKNTCEKSQAFAGGGIISGEDEKHKKGGITMTKTISIEGMSCKNCVRHVKEALEGVEGVLSADVSLEKNEAVVESEGSVSDEVLKNAVDEAGYKVVDIK